MQENRKVTYSLDEAKILDIDIIQFSESVKGNKKSKSQIVEDALIACFDIFEEELRAVDKMTYVPINFRKTIIQTYTISVDVANKLDYYASELGIKKSYLILAGITLMSEQQV